MKNEADEISINGEIFDVLAIGTQYRVYSKHLVNPALETRVYVRGEQIGSVEIFPAGNSIPRLYYRLMDGEWVRTTCISPRDAVLELINAYLKDVANEKTFNSLTAISGLHDSVW